MSSTGSECRPSYMYNVEFVNILIKESSVKWGSFLT